MTDIFTLVANSKHVLNESSKNIVWRLVYFKPNSYSRELISVGVIVRHDNQVLVDHVGSSDALDAFTNIFGAAARDQLIWGLKALKQAVVDPKFQFNSDGPPTNLFEFSKPAAAVCGDTRKFSRDLLRLSSSLFKRYEVISRRFISVGQGDVKRRLMQRIVQLNPFCEGAIIRDKKVHITDELSFHVPLYGERTIGAPVSLMTPRLRDALKGAEAQMLRLSHATTVLKRSPHLYVYTPPLSGDDDSFCGRVVASVNELKTLGGFCGVTVSSADSIESLAESVLHNEDLEPTGSLTLQ